MVDENNALVPVDKGLESLDLPFEDDLAPHEQLDTHVRKITRMWSFGRAFANTARWHLGIMYRRLMENPGVYVADEADYPESLSDAGAILGTHKANVMRARDIVDNYTRDLWSSYRFLPFTALQEAIQLPPARREEILDGLVEKWKEGKLGDGEAVETVRDHLQKLESVADATGEEPDEEKKEEEEDPAGSPPPITSLQSKMVALTKVVTPFRDAAASYVYSREDLANLEGLIDEGRTILEDLEQAYNEAKNSQ